MSLIIHQGSLYNRSGGIFINLQCYVLKGRFIKGGLDLGVISDDCCYMAHGCFNVPSSKLLMTYKGLISWRDTDTSGLGTVEQPTIHSCGLRPNHLGGNVANVHQVFRKKCCIVQLQVGFFVGIQNLPTSNAHLQSNSFRDDLLLNCPVNRLVETKTFLFFSWFRGFLPVRVERVSRRLHPKL